MFFGVTLHGMSGKVEVESFAFTESAKELRNPNRGFYRLYRFTVTEELADYTEFVETQYLNDTDTELTLVQICLQAYRQSAIGENGLANIEGLFRALDGLDKQLIIRFMYDEEGQNELHEPESIDIILQHMEQLRPVLHKRGRGIFIIQGLFTGNWGEMNGTRYSSAEDMQCLAGKLEDITDSSTYLAVRMPAQWRSITGNDNPSEALTGCSLAGRLSLFNDGMLGSESDYGTYLSEEFTGVDEYGRWEREKELDFQRILCREVPNGGEVIHDNSYNDFENAVKGLSAMHVTYLNKDYDQTVLDKWKSALVTEEGCFYGMDGYTYIERHLGYRLLIKDAELIYSKEKSCVNASVTLKNVGFAPLYKIPEIKVTLRSKKDGQILKKKMSCAVKELAGGEESEVLQDAYAEILLEGLERGEYDVYFSMEDPADGKTIMLANEQEEEEHGYRIGRIIIY